MKNLNQNLQNIGLDYNAEFGYYECITEEDKNKLSRAGYRILTSKEIEKKGWINEEICEFINGKYEGTGIMGKLVYVATVITSIDSQYGPQLRQVTIATQTETETATKINKNFYKI